MTDWHNRIVAEGDENPDQLLANPFNWRVHPKHQQVALAKVLDTVGWVQRVIVNRVSGHLLDGHLRVSLALSRGEQAVPVSYVDLDEDEERLVLLTFDAIGAQAATDRLMLVDLLAKEQSDSIARVIHEDVLKHDDKARDPEARLSPELGERQDYLVIVFDNEIDWRSACDKLGVQAAQDADADPVGQQGKRFGLGRVLTGADLLSRLA